MGQRGIYVHRVRGLDPADRAERDGIPVTTVARTLLDYAEVARPQQLRLAIETGDRRELFDGRAVGELLARSPGRRGVKPLKQVLGEMRGEAPWTRSELERAFQALIRDAKLSEPSANVLIAGESVDFVWPGARVVVEVDGYEWHKTRNEFERDRIRDTKLQLAGYRVMRATQPRIEHAPGGLLGDLVRMLNAAPGAGRSGP